MAESQSQYLNNKNYIVQHHGTVYTDLQTITHEVSNIATNTSNN